MRKEKRIDKRRKFNFFMRVMDDDTHEILGYLVDISPQGFRLECQKALPVQKEYTLRLEGASIVSDRPYIVFVARAVWSQPDPVIPHEFIEGFRIITIPTFEQEIYLRLAEKYGTTEI